MARHEIVCPFCGFRKDDEYGMQLHIEEHHTEDSPFNIVNALPGPGARSPSQAGAYRSASRNDPTTRTRLGRPDRIAASITRADLSSYTTTGQTRRTASGNGGYKQRSASSGRSRSPSVLDGRMDTSGASRGGHNRWEGTTSSAVTQSSRSQQSASGRTLLEYFSGQSSIGRPPLPPRPKPIPVPVRPGRLGKRELGPHAFEPSMPAEVRRRLLNDALPRRSERIGKDGRLVKHTFIENETLGLVPVLVDLCAHSRTAQAAYFCDPSVRHVRKIRCEGNFCGYWNIQMMCSFLAHNAGDSALLPNVLEIQDKIEEAWDNGICSYSRVETDGIRGTRKWIGTHDALAYFTRVGVQMQALSFKDEDDEQPSHVCLLDHIEAYFLSGAETAVQRQTSFITRLPPVYLQRAGHSITVVGLERKTDGQRNLMVFDPSYGTTRPMEMLLDGKRPNAEPRSLLKPYRRNDEHLSRWKEFEILIPQPKECPKAS